MKYAVDVIDRDTLMRYVVEVVVSGSSEEFQAPIDAKVSELRKENPDVTLDVTHSYLVEE